MSADVVDFKKYREQKNKVVVQDPKVGDPVEAWLSGDFKCMNCGEVFVAAVPMPVMHPVECPACGCDRGMPITEIPPTKEGGRVFACTNCGSNLFFITQDQEGNTINKCSGCGMTVDP